MKYHELTILTDTNTDNKKDITEIKKQIEKAGGIITRHDDGGVKLLAYKVNGHEYANYDYLYIKTEDPKFSAALCSWLNTYDPVIRYLCVQADTRNGARIKYYFGEDAQAPKPKVSRCPYCGTTITKLGVQTKKSWHLYPDGGWSDDGDIGDIEEYYCHECGETLPDTIGQNIYDHFMGEDND